MISSLRRWAVGVAVMRTLPELRQSSSPRRRALRRKPRSIEPAAVVVISREMRDSKRDPLAGAFSRRLACAPSAPLVVSPRRRATAADVDGLAAALAARLSAGGIRQGELVALLAPNGPAFLAALLAVRRAGAAALLLDARAPAAARRRTVADLAAGHLLTTADGWSADAGSWTLETLPSSAGGAEPLPPDVAVVKLTSGSTGEARGIATPAAALLADDEALVATMGIRPATACSPPSRSPTPTACRAWWCRHWCADCRWCCRRTTGRSDRWRRPPPSAPPSSPPSPPTSPPSAASPSRRHCRRPCAWC